MRSTSLLLWLVVMVISFASASGFLSINLTSLGHSYEVPMVVSGARVKLIVDTGNSQLMLYNSTSLLSNTTTQALSQDTAPCLFLSEDMTGVDFKNYIHSTGVLSGSCDLFKGPTYFGDSISSRRSTGGNSHVVVNFSTSNYLLIDNPYLHPWGSSQGDIGMAYCNNGMCLGTSSSFQQLLLNDTGGNNTLQHSIFGLDFQAPQHNAGSGLQGNNNSTMQIGGVSHEYASSMVWLAQATDSPTYHEAMIKNLNICGNDLLSSYSNDWPVLVDTGSSCINLPAEIYDTFASWFDTKAVPDTQNFPALTFSLSIPTDNENIDAAASPSSAFASVASSSSSSSTQQKDQVFYISLASLMVNSTFFEGEPGAPFMYVNQQPQKLCVLRGGTILKNDGSGNFLSPPPRIVLGSLALRSLYFGADFTSYSVGFANKLSAVQIKDHVENDALRCLPRAKCIGQQQYSKQSNSCQPPPCDNFFFVLFDSATQSCLYDPNALGAGLFLVILFTIVEATAFFVYQYSALQALGMVPGSGIHATSNGGTPRALTRPNTFFKVDPITRFIGKWCTKPVDYFVTRVLGWVPSSTSRSRLRSRMAGGDVDHGDVELQEQREFNERGR